MALGPGRFAGVVRDVASTTAQRGFPSQRASGIGGTGFVPTHLPGCELWLDAADTDTITSSSGGVSQWNDKSGFGRNVSQATSSAQPGTGSATQNGLNVLTFDGGDWLSNTAPWLWAAESVTTVAVIKGAAQSNAAPIAEGYSGGNNPIYRWQVGVTNTSQLACNIRNDAGTNLASDGNTGSVVFDNAWHVASLTDETSRFVTHVDGIAGTTISVTRSGTLTLDRFAVGALLRGTASNHFNGSIAEIALFRGALNATQRRQLERHFRAKWATP